MVTEVRERPAGVSVLAVYLFLEGLVFLCGATQVLPTIVSSGSLDFTAVSLLILLCLSVPSLVGGVGLWRLRKWAWILTMVQASLIVASGVLSAAVGIWTLGTVPLVVFFFHLPRGIVLYYLLRPHVRSLFGR